MHPTSEPSTASSGTSALHDGDLETLFTGGRGHLGSDPAASDDGEAAAALEPGGERVGVIEVAKVVNAVEVGSGDGQPPRLGAGREQQPLVAHPLAALHDDDLPRAGVDVLDVPEGRSPGTGSGVLPGRPATV